ncbi:PspC domain-containing protein [Actinophytocola oryzae]|uniref:PspC domain-containing protein n=1 Tax=Actinophytocola oryzae TaxID=502181 RepID=UPI0014151A90|nr:PspC domain-containing protein [Actinophytocola oryzae]
MSATQGPSGATRIEDTVKDFWATRPRRPRRGRKIAGVAAGIANRYRIDPVLVRVGLAVAAIYGGAGVLVYLLGWLFLPEQDDEASPIEALFGKGRSSTSSGFTILLGIITVPVSGWFLSGSFTGEFSSWMSLLVVGGLVYLLHHARGNQVPMTSGPAAPTPEPPPVPMPTMPLTTPMATPAPTPSATMPVEPPVGRPADVPPPYAPEPEPRTSPPSWDPLGAAPFAWDLPEPAVPEPEEPAPPVKRRKPRIGTATLGLVLLAVAGLAIAANAPWASGWITPQHAVGIVLAIVGLGLVAGAFARAGRGLIALAVPLSVAGMAMSTISPEGYNGLGDLNVRPVTITSVQDSYARSIGDVELDLTGLPETGVISTDAHTDIGNVTVIVPESADVTLTCEARAGNIDCLGKQQDGIDQHAQTTDPGGPGGLTINLHVSTDAGNVEVRRG